ncbi:MAG: hypothetical protein KDA92_08210 [Planctomycetales bacterium]|nr:hypothetical protein [Planctomycetales bacterium]
MTSHGRIHVVYVTQHDDRDDVFLASSSPRGMQVEPITTVPHSDQPLTGVQAISLTLDSRDRPWVFLYTRDVQPEGPIFAELIASRTGGRVPWEVTTIRRSVNRDGGAGLSYPHLLVDGRQRFHVFSYVHNGFGEIHRIRHRYDSGNGYPIVSLPRPAGKSDSSETAVALDATDRIHVLYSSTKALLGGRAEPGYPSASLTYTTWQEGSFAEPEIVAETVTTPENENRETLLSLGVNVGRRDELHGLFLAGRIMVGAELRLEYVHGQLGRQNRWARELIQTTPPLELPVSATVSQPEVDRGSVLHFTTCRDKTSYYWHRVDNQWIEEEVPGEMQGFALIYRRIPLLLTRQDSVLTLWRRR